MYFRYFDLLNIFLRIERMYISLANATGGINYKYNGISYGSGYTAKLIVVAIIDIHTDNKYPIIVAVRALFINTWKNIDNEFMDNPQPAKISNNKILLV